MTRFAHRVIAPMARVTSGTRMRALVAAVLLLVASALPVAAAAPVGLIDPTATPVSATTQTDIKFSVSYKSKAGIAPAYVRVSVAGKAYALSAPTGSTAWRQSVMFTLTTRLPAGSWPVVFQAADVRGDTTSAPGPTLVIKAVPAPTPAPTPKPTPAPTPKPTPAPTPKPTSAPTPRPTADPTSSPAPTSRPRPGSTATASPGAAPTAIATLTPTPAPTATQAPIAAIVPGGGGGTGDPRGDGSASGPAGFASGPAGSGSPGAGSAALAGSLGSSSAAEIAARLAPAMVVTTGGVAMAMAFLAFGKRRRDETPTAPDAVLAAAAASGMGVPAASRLVPGAPVADRPPSASDAASLAASLRAAAVVVPAAGVVDGDLPRWRRPSLMEARKADPTRTVHTTVNLRFEGQAGDAVSALERRRIRYRLVGLLDQPDDVRGIEIGTLDEGDEVVLLERHGTYWRVLCPDGREGWLHKMVLGAAVGVEAPDQPAASWTSGDEGPAAGSFEDVLRLYMEHRRQLGET